MIWIHSIIWRIFITITAILGNNIQALNESLEYNYCHNHINIIYIQSAFVTGDVQTMEEDRRRRMLNHIVIILQVERLTAAVHQDLLMKTAQ